MARNGQIRMHDWDIHQTFRKDRGAPPWVKVHRNIMSSPKWVALTDLEKGQLISMWVVAADSDGYLPDDPKLIRKMCALDELPNLERFKELQWLDCDGCQHGVNMASNGCQYDAPETEAETEGEKKEREERQTPLAQAETPKEDLSKYAFEGKVIRLLRSQRQAWDTAFPFIDVIGHLKSLDEHYAGLEDKGEKIKGNWFIRCSKALEAANRREKEMRGGMLI